MGQKRRTHSEEFKARVAVEAIKGVRTLSELSTAHGVHPSVIAHWKRQLLDGAPEVFRRGPGSSVRSEDELTAPLYQEIGRLKMAVEWLKHKALSASPETRRGKIQAASTALSIVQQRALVGLAHSTYYDAPAAERRENLVLMRLIDRLYLQRPFYGMPRMTDWPQTLRHAVNHKRVERLMRVMGLQAVPGPHTSRPQPGASAVSVLVEADRGGEAQPGVVRGHHLRADAARVPVPGGDHGLIQPLRGGLGVGQHVGQHHGRACLRRGAGTGLGQWALRDLQHRSGCAIHQPGVSRVYGRGWGARQYGRTGACAG